MPQYSFQCSDCNHAEQRAMSINEFLSTRSVSVSCPICQNGKLQQMLSGVYSKIERRREEVVQQMEAEVQATKAKIMKGDIKTISDIYGENPNPLKNLEIGTDA